MSYHQPNEPAQPYGAYPPQEKSGSGRIWLFLGLGCGGLLLLCCGGFALFGYFAAQTVANSTSDDPAVARERATEIAEVAIPADFEPKFSIDMAIPFQGEKLFTIVAYTSPSQDANSPNLIVLGQFGTQFPANTRDEMMDQLHNSIRQELAHEDVEIDQSTSHAREFEINGEPAEFIFEEGKGRQSKQAFRTVMGQFRGKSGMAVLYVRVEADKYDEEALVKIVESITVDGVAAKPIESSETTEGAEPTEPAENEPAEEAKSEEVRF